MTSGWKLDDIWHRLQNRKNHIYGGWKPTPSTNLGRLLEQTKRIDIINYTGERKETIFFDYLPIAPEHRHIYDGIYPTLYVCAIYHNYKLVGNIAKDTDLEEPDQP